MSDVDQTLTQLTVNLTDSAYEALEVAAAITGDSRTDTAGRALLMYAHIVQQAAVGRGSLSFDLADGGPRVFVKVRRPWWRFW